MKPNPIPALVGLLINNEANPSVKPIKPIIIQFASFILNQATRSCITIQEIKILVFTIDKIKLFDIFKPLLFYKIVKNSILFNIHLDINFF